MDSEILAAPSMTAHKAHCFRESMRTRYPGTPHWTKIHSASLRSKPAEMCRPAFYASCSVACVTKPGRGMDDSPMLLLRQTKCGCVFAAVSTCSGWGLASGDVSTAVGCGTHVMMSILGPHAGPGILVLPLVSPGAKGFGPVMCAKHDVFLPACDVLRPRHCLCEAENYLEDVAGAGKATFTGADILRVDAVEVYVPA